MTIEILDWVVWFLLMVFMWRVDPIGIRKLNREPLLRYGDEDIGAAVIMVFMTIFYFISWWDDIVIPYWEVLWKVREIKVKL